MTIAVLDVRFRDAEVEDARDFWLEPQQAIKRMPILVTHRRAGEIGRGRVSEQIANDNEPEPLATKTRVVGLPGLAFDHGLDVCVRDGGNPASRV